MPPHRGGAGGSRRGARTLSVTSEQLHGLACAHCNDVKGPLAPAGHMRTENRPDEYLVWAVVACPDHSGAQS